MYCCIPESLREEKGTLVKEVHRAQAERGPPPITLRSQPPYSLKMVQADLGQPSMIPIPPRAAAVERPAGQGAHPSYFHVRVRALAWALGRKEWLSP